MPSRSRLRQTLSRSIFVRATPEIASPSYRRDFGGGHGFGHAGPSVRARPPGPELAGGERRTRLGADDAEALVLRAARAPLHGYSASRFGRVGDSARRTRECRAEWPDAGHHAAADAGALFRSMAHG